MSPLSVLIMGQSPEENGLIKSYLRECVLNAYAVSEAFTIDEGLRKIHEIHFDVVMMDLSVKGNFTFDNLCRLQKVFPALPVVAITDAMDHDNARRVLQHGAQEFLEKNTIHPAMLDRVIMFSMERMQFKTHLKKQESQLIALTKNNRDGMVIVDQKNVIHFCNPAAEAILHPMGIGGVGYSFPWSLSKFSTFTKNVQRKNDTLILEIHNTPIPWEDETMHLVTLRDVTTVVHAEKAQREAEALKGMKEMAAGIAHEFSQPLQVLSGTLEIMGAMGVTEERIQKCRAMSEKIVHLVNALRDLTHIRKRDYLNYQIMDIQGSSKKPLNVQ